MKFMGKVGRLRTSAEKLLPFISLFVMMVVLSVSTPHFLTWGNVSSIIRQNAQIIIMAVGMTFVIVSGGIDLSVGSMMALAGICGTWVMTLGVPIPLAVLVGCLAGLVCGLLNGFAIRAPIPLFLVVPIPVMAVLFVLRLGKRFPLTLGIILFVYLVAFIAGQVVCRLFPKSFLVIPKLTIPPFIATLGTMQAFRGLVLEITKGLPVDEGIPRSFGNLRNGNVFGVIPIPLIMIVVVAVLASLTLRYTRLGRYSYAIGSNVEAAHHSGIKVGRYLVLIYAVCGLLAGLGGMIEFSSLVSGQPTAGVGYELKVIAAVVIGGGSLMGGEGTVSGTIAGALLMALLLNGCTLLRISDYVQQIVIGTLIVLAVAFDQFRKRKLQGGGT